MIKITMPTKPPRAIRQLAAHRQKVKEACDKALKAEWQQMVGKLWADQQRALLNIEARQLAQWLKWYR